MSPMLAPIAEALTHAKPAPHSPLLRRALELSAEMPGQSSPEKAFPLDSRSREIERLKMTRPRAAAESADAWLEESLAEAMNDPGEECVGQLSSALSTWGAIRRNLGELGDAALAAHRALQLLLPRPYSTRAGFALQRAAFVLADLGEVADGLAATHQAVAVHQLTPGGRHNAAIATAGVAAYHLFYRRAFDEARAAYLNALEAIVPFEDQVYLFGISHGIAYSYLMEGDLEQARQRVAALYELTEMEADQELRLEWTAAEIEVAAGDHETALALYEGVFPRTLELTEAAGSILVAFDISRLLLAQGTGSEEWDRWRDPFASVARSLDDEQAAATEPFFEALATGRLTVELLDRTAVAFKRATNRMLLGMGRKGGAGRPETLGVAA